MTIRTLGISFKTAPLDVLERASFAREHVEDATRTLLAVEGVREAFILSTCNRSEVTTVGGAASAVSRAVEDLTGLREGEMARAGVVRAGRDAVAHLFAVASGIDSMVLGERQILTQVRRALRAADHAGGAGPALSRVVRGAIHAGRRARAETAIEGCAPALVEVVVDRAATHVGGLTGRRVLILGAGKVSRMVARAIASSGALVGVTSRTEDSARALAGEAGGAVVELGEGLASADVVIASTASPAPLVSVAGVRTARAATRRPLLVVDLAVPRDVAAEVGREPGVTLWNIEDVRAMLPARVDRTAVGKVRAIVDEEVARTLDALRASSVGPLLRRLAGTPHLTGRERHEAMTAVKVLAGAGSPGAFDRATRMLYAPSQGES
ncbi:MAG TPA: glutamyl-tRNA reductase [Actinomycetota bacterium]